jgi:uroporphyrinogen decarboxylase
VSNPFSVEIKPDWEALMACIRREGTPRRVHHIELFLDAEILDETCRRHGPCDDLDPADPHYELRRAVRIQQFLGYDYIRCGVDPFDMPLRFEATEDTAGKLGHKGGRNFIDEHRGPITNWDEFEQYPWPDPAKLTTTRLEWLDKNLPEGMCVIGGGGFGHFAEHLTWLMGYTTFCTSLFEQRDLVIAIRDRLLDIEDKATDLILQHPCVKALWGSDDMGYRGGPLMAPADMKELVLTGHRTLAAKAHDRGLPYLLHSCGNLALIMDDLLDYVGIDAKHSFEDTIEDVRQVKHTYGQRIALLGGIDLDFLCRADEAAVRARVRDTLDQCMPGGGYCLGTGNSVANYIPYDNYIAMLDEGRRYAG